MIPTRSPVFWGSVVGVFAIFFYCFDYLCFILASLGYASTIFLGVMIGLYLALFSGKKHSSGHLDEPVGEVLKELMRMGVADVKTPASVKSTQPIFSRNIDSSIEEVLDLTSRDYILSWLQELITDHLVITEAIKEDIWCAIHSFKERLSKIDEVKFLTHTAAIKLCQHYQRIRQASCSNGKERKPTFLLRPYLVSEETEIEFLRKLSELLIIQLAPESYAQSMPVRHLLREVLACSVLYPTVSMLCDPDYINQKLLSYLQHHQNIMEQHKKTYTYAASYEAFIKMIHECTNLEQLKHIRYNIMTEIMQATTINNLKKSKGIDLEKEFILQGNSKGDHLQARNLKRYINQLTVAKTACEKRIKALGGPDQSSPTSQPVIALAEDEQMLPESKVLSHEVIMASDFARSFLIKFLSRDDSQFLLEYYVAVEELKDVNKKMRHQLASEIYQVYVPYISNATKLDRGILKGMESFLIGNKGPDAFVKAQEEVYKCLEERYYPNFIVSDLYQKMLLDAFKVGVEFVQTTGNADESNTTSSIGGPSQPTEASASNAFPLNEHSSFAKAKLEQLSEKLNNKLQALDAMKSTQIADTKIITMLQKEVDTMIEDKQQLTGHIDRTEIWSDKLGFWRVEVHSVEVIEEKDKLLLYFLLVVHLESKDGTPEDNDIDDDYDDVYSSNWTNWVVKRRICEFVELSQKLSQMCSWVKTVELPKETKLNSKEVDRVYLEKSTTLLQKFLDAVLKDDMVSKSEVVYAFLSPSPEHLKHYIPSPKKSKFSFSTLFKSSNQSNNSQGDGSDDDELLFFDELDSSLKDDRIAEPLYTLMGEIFDMRGVFMLLRRTLISFVQITFGQTINRQIRETVSWLFSETMVIYYINSFRDSMWPGGKLFSPANARSDEEKLQTRYQAKKQLLGNIPEILSNLVGQQNAKKGTRKVFESLQDVRLNKQLLYELLEMLILELFPEIKGQAL